MLTQSVPIYYLTILIQAASPVNRKLRKVALILAQMHKEPAAHFSTRKEKKRLPIQSKSN